MENHELIIKITPYNIQTTPCYNMLTMVMHSLLINKVREVDTHVNVCLNIYTTPNTSDEIFTHINVLQRCMY